MGSQPPTVLSGAGGLPLRLAWAQPVTLGPLAPPACGPSQQPALPRPSGIYPGFHHRKLQKLQQDGRGGGCAPLTPSSGVHRAPGPGADGRGPPEVQPGRPACQAQLTARSLSSSIRRRGRPSRAIKNARLGVRWGWSSRPPPKITNKAKPQPLCVPGRRGCPPCAEGRHTAPVLRLRFAHFLAIRVDGHGGDPAETRPRNLPVPGEGRPPDCEGHVIFVE